MTILKNIIVAFSLYSQIPMPRFTWKEEDMKHNLVFLPWVGVVIGLLAWGLEALLQVVEVPMLCKLALFSLLPLLVTGGFHVDGYMDVQDALRSYKSREEKLEILKDPHIGAFAVIRLLIYALVWAGALTVCLDSSKTFCMEAFCMLFCFTRTMSAIVALTLKHARKNGMLHMETEKSTRADVTACVVELLFILFLSAWLNPVIALLFAVVAGIHFLYYRGLCYKQFGGITGDTAGFYIVTLEEWILVAIALVSYWI